jgi:glycosyltransferase involved in cell wall biosynthesis
MRRDDFDRVGGYDEAYGYGLEDVDLALKVRRDLGLESVLDGGMRIIHRHGFSRQKDVHASPQRIRNNVVLNRTWGVWLRRQIREGGLAQRTFWTGRRPVVGFTVTSFDVGDYFTALELGRAIQSTADVHVVYVPQEDWADLSALDVVINLSPRFDLHRVEVMNPFAVTINWMRQHFDSWMSQDATSSYDHLICSSQRSADVLHERLAATVHMMPIASDTAQFAAGVARAELKSDYCFTGSYFKVNREIQFNLDPAAINGQGAVFGKDWEGTSLAAISRGPLPYAAMADVYASTRIVIDDGIFATAPWGSVNSRVFDALAAGCLVLTNNTVGAKELFGDLLPTYTDRESLSAAINWWLAHEEARQERVRALQRIVRERHDYRHRARQVLDILSSGTPLRIALKCAARRDNKEMWGDYHFCQSLARALRESGAVVRVDVLEEWDTALGQADDVVITLRGLSVYEPLPHQVNLAWVISHPEDVPLSELAKYDHVMVASAPFAGRLAADLDVPVTTLLQCTDTDHFAFDPARVGSRPDRALFVGSSRGEFRPVVRWAIEQELEIDLYGGGWESFVKDSRLKGNSVPNEVLGGMYASSRVVLCDHWADMARQGFLSNRAFDVLGCGGFLVTDAVAGMEDILPAGSYAVFGDAAELAAHVRAARRVDPEERRAVADWVRENHSFRVRARQILEIAGTHPKLRAWA